MTTAMMDEDVDEEPATRGTDEVDVLDSLGDLYLQVGGDVEKKAKTYLVCSRSLARVSTVFEKMLYGGFAESRPTDAAYKRWTVELPDDRQEPTELLLHIAHGRFDRVPEQLELTRLYQFLVVVNKYDAAGATRPWARGWLEFVQAATLNPLLLGVAYELGHLPTFEIMMRKIADECLVDDDGDLVFGFASDHREAYSYKLRNIEYLAPPGLLVCAEDTASTRMKLLTTMLEPYASLYATLKHGDRCQSSPQDPTSGRRCDSILLGSLIRSFAAQGIDLAAPDPAAAYRGSAATLQAILPRLELYTSQHPGILLTQPSSPLPSPFGQAPRPHFGFVQAACKQELEAALRDGLERSLVLKGQVMFSQPRHGEYLRKQASKTGLTQ